MKKALYKSIMSFIIIGTTIINPYYTGYPLIVSSNAITAQATIQSDVIRWRYKLVKGKKYKRLYNYTTHTWIGEWIPI